MTATAMTATNTYYKMTISDLIASAYDEAHPDHEPPAECAGIIDELARRLGHLDVQRQYANMLPLAEASSDTPESDAWYANEHPSCRFPHVLEQMRKLERERDSMKEVISYMQNEILTLRDWIEQAAPMLNVACCIVIEDSLDRLDEIAGCRGLLELCPVNFPPNAKAMASADTQTPPKETTL